MPRHPAIAREKILADTRQRLLDAAAQEFADKGFAGANVNRISTGAGFARGTIYNYFPSKQALLLAVVKDVAQHLQAFIWKSVVQEPEPEQRLQSCFRGGVAYAEAFPHRFQVALNALLGPDREVKHIILEATRDLFQRVAASYFDGDSTGTGGLSGDRQRMAELLQLLYMGSCPLYGLPGDLWLEPEALVSVLLASAGRPVGGGARRDAAQVTRREESWRQW